MELIILVLGKQIWFPHTNMLRQIYRIHGVKWSLDRHRTLIWVQEYVKSMKIFSHSDFATSTIQFAFWLVWGASKQTTFGYCGLYCVFLCIFQPLVKGGYLFYNGIPILFTGCYSWVKIWCLFATWCRILMIL